MVKNILLSACVLLVASVHGQADMSSDPERKDMKPALLVIDIQEAYLPMMDGQERDLALRMINGAIWLFRQHDLPVIRVYHSDPQFGPNPGDKAFEFPGSVIIKDDDPRIVKNFPSAFTKTDLDSVLRGKNVDTVYLCGLSAVGCVLATYFGAVVRGYETFMVKNAVMSHKAAYTKVVEDITETVSFKTLQFMLEHLRE